MNYQNTGQPGSNEEARPGASRQQVGPRVRVMGKRAAATQTKPKPKDNAPYATPIAQAPALPRVRGLRDLLARVDTPATSYYLILSCTLILVFFGLLMVWSSSSVELLLKKQSPYASVSSQALFAVLGIATMFIVSLLPVKFMEKIALPAFIVSIGLQLLVFSPLGTTVLGNRNWLNLGFFTFQPSELLKVTLILLIATMVSRSGNVSNLRAVILNIGVPFGLVVGVIMGGGDLGTALIPVLIAVGLSWVAGVPKRYFGAFILFCVGGVFFFVKTSANRMNRVFSFLNSNCDVLNECWQSTHALRGLASGGIGGVGLGESTQKWSYLPEVENDFIFAIVGEELGLIGTILLLLLYVGLLVGMIRIILRHESAFVKLTTAGIMFWIIGQSLINIAVVVKFMPVLGVPLPLVSHGGTALICTLLGMGLLLSFARTEPGAKAALEATPAGAQVRRVFARMGRNS